MKIRIEKIIGMVACDGFKAGVAVKEVLIWHTTKQEELIEKVAQHFNAIKTKQGWAFKGAQSNLTKQRDYTVSKVLEFMESQLKEGKE